MGQLLIDLSIREFKYCASKTILSGSPFAGFKSVYPVDCDSLPTGDRISY